MMMMGWDCCWTWNECHALRCVWFMEVFLVNCLRDLAGYGTCCKISSFSSLRCLLSLSLSLSLSLPQVYSGYIAPCFKRKRSIARSQMPMFRCCLLYCNCREPTSLSGLFECFIILETRTPASFVSLHVLLTPQARTPVSLPPIMSKSCTRSVFAFLVHSRVHV